MSVSKLGSSAAAGSSPTFTPSTELEKSHAKMWWKDSVDPKTPEGKRHIEGIVITMLFHAKRHSNTGGDAIRARWYYRQAAELGSAEAQYLLGWMCQNGEGGEKDPLEAVTWWEKAAAQGHSGAKFSLGKPAVFRPTPRKIGSDDSDSEAESSTPSPAKKSEEKKSAAPSASVNSSHEELMKRAKAGDVQAYFEIGKLLEGEGTKVPEYYKAAFNMYAKAADTGHIASQHALAKMLQVGREGVPKDTERANQIFEKLRTKGFF